MKIGNRSSRITSFSQADKATAGSCSLSAVVHQAAHRALTDVYDAPFVREGDPAVQRFGQAKVSTRAIVEWFDENMLRLHKQIADLENLVKSKRRA